MIVPKYFNHFQIRHPIFDLNDDVFSNYIRNENIETHSLYSINFSSEEKELEDLNLNLTNNSHSHPFFPLNFLENPKRSLIEDDKDINKRGFLVCESESNKKKIDYTFLKLPKKKPIFTINYSPKYSLFAKEKINSCLSATEEEEEKESFLNVKRSKIRRKRKENRDNMRKKIKRGFFNNALNKELNNKLKSIGSKKYFEKFPQSFVCDIDQKRNNKILNMTLREIFEQSELYKKEDKKGLINYYHNLLVIQSEEIKENEIFQIILNETILQLYQEYLNSDKFKIDEIERLKKYNMNDDYIERYKDLAKNLIKFFHK